MRTAAKRPRISLIVDKAMLKRILDEQNRRSGFIPDPAATAQKAREMMLAAGVRPEDCIFTRELLAMREE